MCKLPLSVIFLISLFIFPTRAEARPDFNAETDLLVLQFDSKTDADDIHSIAATGSILKTLGTDSVSYIAVAGAYGKQWGLYIPSPELFDMVFPDKWVDAHNERNSAINSVYEEARETLFNHGNVWVMEAGQSDISSKWLAMLKRDFSADTIKQHVHIVQHSDWNEEQATPGALGYVKYYATYHRIEDGNYTNNSTAGFHEVNANFVDTITQDPIHGESWSLALSIANKYNGLENRYRNPMIAKENGLDFSDVVELVWILQLDEIKDVDDFANWLKIY